MIESKNAEQSGFIKNAAMADSATRTSAEGTHLYKKGQCAEGVALESGELFPLFDGVNANLLVSLGFATKTTEVDEKGEKYTKWEIAEDCKLQVTLLRTEDREFRGSKYKKKIYEVKKVK